MTNSSQHASAQYRSTQQRTAGTWQAVLLLAGSCLPVLGSVLLTPILPQLSKVFADTPGSEVLVPLIVAIPALMIALFAPFAGQIVDRLGRKTLLIVAMFVYGIVGTAPLYLDTLGAILASRVGVGIAEAAIMTCCTTLIVDYFHEEKRRNKYLSLQTVVTTLAATVFFAVGGALGAAGWRTPFWVYASAFVIAIPMIFSLWQPARADGADARAIAAKMPVPWSRLRLPLVVALFGGFSFYVFIIELSYLLVGVGVTETPLIGLASALASLATAAGAFTFARVSRRGPKVLLPIGFGLQAVGMLLILVAPAFGVVIVAALIAGAGSGLLLPTMLTWALASVTFAERGRSTGWWQSAFFFGQFLTPLIMGALTAAVGGLPAAVGVVGGFCAVVAIALAVGMRNSAPVQVIDEEVSAPVA